MDNSEPDVKIFFKKIAATISAILLWMLINALIGIKLNYAFFDDRPNAGNYIFYGWFLISLALLAFYIRRKWTVKN